MSRNRATEVLASAAILSTLRSIMHSLDVCSLFRRLTFFTALSLANAIAYAGESDPRINSETGQQIAQWPPARPFDHLDMVLELELPSIHEAKLHGTLTLTLEAVGESRDRLVLQCKGPLVETVTYQGKPCVFESSKNQLTISLPHAIPVGGRCEVQIKYSLDFSKNRGEGLTYSRAIKGDQSPTRSHPQIHAQGQAELNSRWFPCHDSPNERLTSRLLVTVKDGYDVFSNGRLIRNDLVQTPDTSGNPRRRWEWFQSTPHAPYLVTLVIGKFATIDLGGDQSARPGLPLTVHTPIGTEKRVAELYSATAEMVAFFEKTFDEPYPWDRYAQVIVRDFSAGGMENTSCTLMTTGSTKGENGSQDDLIAHELAHQWLGDLVTCNSWEHIWLNEGWASYGEALWNEHKGARVSAVEARKEYQRTMRGFFQSQRFRNKSSYPLNTAMVSNRYTDPDSVFSKPEDPYAKGAIVLHMLRMRLGDEIFFKALRTYIDLYKFKTVETDQFRRVMERASGQSLERFFDQWALRPGLPRLDIELDWDEAAGTLEVEIEQTQTINALNPAYAFTLPLRVKMADGSTRWFEVDMDSASVSATFPLEAKPTQVSIDPLMTVIAPTTIRKDIAWWIDEAINPPTYVAGVAAREYLATAHLTQERSEYLCIHGIISGGITYGQAGQTSNHND